MLGRPTVGDQARIDQPSSRIMDVLSNDLFGPGYLGDRLITKVTQPTGGGSVVIDAKGKTFRYTPGTQSETFTYTVDNLFTESVYISVIPWLNSDSAIADQNGSAISVDVLLNDFTAGDIADYGTYLGHRELSVDSRSKHGGTVFVSPDNKVIYTPIADFAGQDSFTYMMDGFLTQTVAVNVIRRAADDRVRVAPNSQNNILNVLVNDIHGADYSGSGLISNVTASSAGAVIAISDDRRTLTESFFVADRC